MPVTESTEAAQLAASFVEEARALLEEAGEALLTLERDPDDAEAINALFRAVHSIKGAAGLFDLPALVHLVHAGEDLLGAMREGRLRMDGGAADELLEGLDHVGRWIEEFREAGTLAPEAMAIARHHAAAYRARLEAPGESVRAKPVATSASVRHAWAGVAAIRTAAPTGTAVLTIEYVPDAACFFSGDDPVQIAHSVPGLVWSEIVPREAWPAPADFDPYVCNLVFRLASTAGRAAIEDHFRYTPDAVTIGVLDEPVAEAPADALPPLARELVAA